MDNQERIIHYRFTAYLIKSIQNYKARYLPKKELRQKIETLVGNLNDFLPEQPENHTDSDLLSKDLQNTAFEKALEKIKARDVRILLLHLLEEYSLKEISELLDINHNTVLSIYTRTIKKIRSEMEDEKHGL